jgi:hypothetical protein
MKFIAQLSALGHDVQVTRVVLPAAAIAEPLPAASKDLSRRLCEQVPVERLHIRIRRFIGAAVEEDRKPYLSSIELVS